jgi:hypothetical protein
MLHIFHIYVASILSGCCLCLQCFSSVFQVFQTHVLSISSVFFYVGRVVSACFKSKSVLHMRYAWEAGGGACDPRTGSREGVGDMGAAERRSCNAGPRVDAQNRTADAGIHLDVRTLAVPQIIWYYGC